MWALLPVSVAAQSADETPRTIRVVMDNNYPPYFLNKLGIAAEFRRSAPVNVGKSSRAVRKGDAALLRSLESGFAAIGSSELKRIDEKWFGSTLAGGRYFAYAGFAATVALVLIAGLVGWNRSLRKMILHRTTALQESEQRFRQLAENIREVFWLTDPVKMTMLYVSSAYEDIWGRTCASLFASPMQWMEAIHPNDRERVRLAAMTQQTTGTYDEEYRIVRPDDSICWIRDRAFPVRNAAGEVYRIAGVAEDITERKRAEAALRESESRFRTIFEQAPLGISEGEIATARFVSANQRFTEILGYTIDELRALTFKDYTLPEDLPKDLVEFEKLAAEEIRTYAMEKRYIRKDGAIIWVNLTVSGLASPGEKPLNCMAVIEDITARKHAEEAIRQLNAELEQRVAERTAELELANKELAAFSYSISHDLRAPLRAMDGYARAVREEFGPKLPEQGRRYLDTIRTETQRMADLIDDLLEFSRLGRQPLHRQPVKMTEIVRAALDRLGSERQGRQIDLRVGDLPPCHGDPVLLQQVWVNLLSNALKYARKCEQTRIEIGCTPRDGQNVFFVRDNGAGFDMRYVGKLFGVFQRLHHAEDYPGTGVGLAIVQQVIQRHGGRVWAEAAVGQGATFYFTLDGEPK